MKHLTLYEAFPTVYAEPSYANQVFTIRYRATSDMSNKRGNDTIDKPENDVLDDFAVGDIVSGKGKEDDKTHTGKVLRIEKDSDGENIGIFIEEDGKEVEILSSTVKMDTEVGNQKALDPAAINPIDKFDPTPTSPFTATTNEKNNIDMRNLRAFSSFINENEEIGKTWSAIGPNWLFDYVMRHNGSGFEDDNLLMPHSELDITIIFFIPKINTVSSNEIRWTWTWGSDNNDINSMVDNEMKSGETQKAGITGDTPKDFVNNVDKYISDVENRRSN